jgi:hypothetical protein
MRPEFAFELGYGLAEQEGGEKKKEREEEGGKN